MHYSRGLCYEDLKTRNSFLPLHHTYPHTNLYTYPDTCPLSGWEKATIYHFILTRYKEDKHKVLKHIEEARNTRLLWTNEKFPSKIKATF